MHGRETTLNSLDNHQHPVFRLATMDCQQLESSIRGLSLNSEPFSDQLSQLPVESHGEQRSNGQRKSKSIRSTSSYHHLTSGNTRQYPTRIPLPRPFEELHNERSYLMVNLQQQDERTKNIMARLLRAQERANYPNTPIEARKLRKQAGRLRSDLANAERQEKSILSRLSELYVEIQRRERWEQVQQRTVWQPQTPQFASPSQLLSPISPITPLPYGWYHPPSVALPSLSPLSPTSPEFIPGAFYFRDPNWGVNEGDTSRAVESSNYSPGWPRDEQCEAGNKDIPHELNGWDLSSGNNSRSMSTPTPSNASMPRTPERRMSLPAPDHTFSLD